MAYRWRGRFFEVDVDNPSAEGICDRCGLRFNLKNLAWQYGYQGSQTPQNMRLLVCQRGACNDPLNDQDSPNLLSPDPLPVYNARPENYVLDEASWLLTEDSEVITTQDGDYIGTQAPTSPEVAANTSYLSTAIASPGATVTVAYLDLFNGDPSNGGVSVLSAITGSSTRTDVASSLSLARGNSVYVNPDYLVVTTESTSQTNVSFIGLYSASISGALLYSGSIAVSQSIAEGNPVAFQPLGLTINRA